MTTLKVGEAKVKLRTEKLTAEISGTIVGCINQMFLSVADVAAREELLSTLRVTHADMLRSAATRAAFKAVRS